MFSQLRAWAAAGLVAAEELKTAGGDDPRRLYAQAGINHRFATFMPSPDVPGAAITPAAPTGTSSDSASGSRFTAAGAAAAQPHNMAPAAQLRGQRLPQPAQPGAGGQRPAKRSRLAQGTSGLTTPRPSDASPSGAAALDAPQATDATSVQEDEPSSDGDPGPSRRPSRTTRKTSRAAQQPSDSERTESGDERADNATGRGGCACNLSVHQCDVRFAIRRAILIIMLRWSY